MDRSFQSFTGSKTPSFLKAPTVVFFVVDFFVLSPSALFLLIQPACV